MFSKSQLICWGFLLLLLLQIQMSDSVERSEDRVSLKIYKNIAGVLACFRRMNGTHQIGCSSASTSGDVGVIHVVTPFNRSAEKIDVDWITTHGPHSPYVAVLYPVSFRADILDQFSSSGKVKGVLLLHRNDSTAEVDEFSTDKSCPNRGYGFYRDPQTEFYCPNPKWNERNDTNELLFRDWGFPIFYVPEVADPQIAEVEGYGIGSILDCFEKYNKPMEGVPREWPLCAAQLNAFMNAAVDTPTCLRRSQPSQLSITQRKDCDPLGDRNLITSLVPSNQSDPYPDKSVIVIAARLDSASIIDKVNPAADTVATALTTVLTALKQLYSIKEKVLESQIKNIYLILFNGEAFDYIGSSRVIYDMSLNKFPVEISTDNTTFLPALLKLKDIKYYIELNQVALRPSETYFIHQNLESTPTVKQLAPLIESIISNGRSQNLNLKTVDQNKWVGVPPSSLQSFLSNTSEFPGIVISNHEVGYRNKFYNSIFDDENNINSTSTRYDEVVESIARLSTTLACTVEGLVTGSSARCSITKDTKIVEDILPCYVKSGKCELFQNVSSAEMLPRLRDKPNFYVGVITNTYDLLTITSLTKNVLAYFQGDIVNRTEESCHTDEKTKNLAYVYLNGSCYETTVITTQALSPAFEINNYNWKSGQYSTWTESVWMKMTVRIFLKPSFIHELTTFLCGVAVFGISFVLVGWISKKTDIIFPSRYIGYTPVSPEA